MVQYGNKLNQQSNQQASEQKLLEQQKNYAEAMRAEIESLKDLIKGDKQLVKQAVEQIHKRGRYDFRIGTIVFHVLQNNFFNNKELNLLLVSEDQKASIRFSKNRNDYIKFVYEFPGIGELEKGYQVTQADIQKRDTTLLGEKRKFESVFFGFAWNLEEKKIILWVNGIEIN